MHTLAQYLQSIMIVSVIAGVVGILAPKDSSGGKYVNFACALVIVVVIAAPLVRLVDVSLPDEIQSMLDLDINEETNQTDHSHLLLHHSREYLSRNTSQMLAQRFGFGSDDVTLHFDIVYEYDTYTIRHIRIDLHTLSAIFRTEEIRSFVTDLFGSEVEMVEDLGVG